MNIPQPRLILLVWALVCSIASTAQRFPVTSIPLINGYAKAISGEVLPYFSVYRQYAKEALLTRCTDGNKSIEWETDTIPATISGDYAYFTWIAAHSSGTSSGIRHFDLYINDTKALTFTTHPQQYPGWWSAAAADSTALQFQFIIRDGASDSHGIAYLRVPLSKYQKGTPLRLKVTGQNQQSNDWYMTFKYAFKEKAETTALPFLLKDKSTGQASQQLLRVVTLHLGPATTLKMQIGENRQEEFKVSNGFSSFDIPIPVVKMPTRIKVKASIEGLLQTEEWVTVNPVTYRELDLVHHSHTDIGYSHIQEEVIQVHNRNIRQALRLIEQTKNYPEGSRFIWHIESAWVVENFLKTARPDEKARFFAAVRKGQMVISANYANVMTGLCMPEELDWITDYAVKLRDDNNLPMNTAMLSDVPGMSWPVVSSLAKRGIRYFSDGINYIEGMPGRGDRIGYALSKNGDWPFWWVSPSGKDSILLWCAGKGYSSWHGTAPGAVYELGPEKIAAYLNQLDAGHYPYEMVQWRYNIVADNGPVDSTICDFVKQWNEKYASPKLVLANVQDLFQRFEKKYGKTIPSYSGDFTPYWEDGAYSTAREETDNRLAAQKIISLEQVIKQQGLEVDDHNLRLAKKYVVLFHEHTWGAYNSISEPDKEFVTHQWKYKKSYLDSALLYTNALEEEVNTLLRKKNTVRVINTANYARSGFIEINPPANYTNKMMLNSRDGIVHVQPLPNGKLGFQAMNVPAHGERTYQWEEVSGPGPRKVLGRNPNAPVYVLSKSTGAISSITAAGREWVNQYSPYNGLLQALCVKGLDPRRYDSARLLRQQQTAAGPWVYTDHLVYSLPGADSIVYDISRYAMQEQLKITLTIYKQAVREKESLHFALPFSLDSALVRMGAGDGVLGPDYHQLPGANKDFYSVARWLNVSDKEGNVTVVSPQAALYELDEMVNEEKTLNGYKRWKTNGSSSALVFLYALNNYWHTNFKADQEGVIRFDVYLQFSHKKFDAAAANRFGYDCTQGLWVVTSN